MPAAVHWPLGWTWLGVSNMFISLETGYLTKSTKVTINRNQLREKYLHVERATEQGCYSGISSLYPAHWLLLLASPLTSVAPERPHTQPRFESRKTDGVWGKRKGIQTSPSLKSGAARSK